MANTLFDRLWEQHTVKELGEGQYLLAVDRIYLHDLCGVFSFQKLDEMNREILRPEAVVVSPDHTVPSLPDRREEEVAESRAILPKLRAGCKKRDVTFYDVGDEDQGIVHIIGPELGYSLPGMTIACGDSHTCTHGAIGALAMGVGTSEVYHVLATSCLRVKKPKTARIWFEGTRAADVGPMDIILSTIATLGIDWGVGCAVEYAGPVVRGMTMDERFTLCNLTIEMGAEYGMISPDETTFEYIRGRKHAPEGEQLKNLIQKSKELASDDTSVFDREVVIDVTGIERQISWGINPGQTVAITDAVPDLDSASSEKERQNRKKAYEYMGFRPGQSLYGMPIQRVFIGACSNGRLSHLVQAAKIVEGQKVAPGVEAWVVPGSEAVRKEAEELGLDQIFTEAGFVWGRPSCSLCAGSNGETVASGQHIVSTTNRNFIGRQGRGACTHLASPVTAAKAAIAGKII